MEKEIVRKIKLVCDRLEKLESESVLEKIDRTTIFMQLFQMHELLDLNRLLAFPEYEFLHDVYGINRFTEFNNSKEFANCFLPRCAK